MAFVRGVIFASTCERSILNVSSSMSTRTGVAPTYRIALMVAANVNGVVMTSSPGPMPLASSAMCNAVVPEETAMACLILNASEKACSNLAVRGPMASMPESRTSITADFSASLILGFEIGIMVPRCLECVLITAGRAVIFACTVFGQLCGTLANVACLTGRIAHDQSVVWDIACDNRTGPNK